MAQSYQSHPYQANTHIFDSQGFSSQPLQQKVSATCSQLLNMPLSPLTASNFSLAPAHAHPQQSLSHEVQQNVLEEQVERYVDVQVQRITTVRTKSMYLQPSATQHLPSFQRTYSELFTALQLPRCEICRIQQSSQRQEIPLKKRLKGIWPLMQTNEQCYPAPSHPCKRHQQLLSKVQGSNSYHYTLNSLPLSARYNNVNNNILERERVDPPQSVLTPPLTPPVVIYPKPLKNRIGESLKNSITDVIQVVDLTSDVEAGGRENVSTLKQVPHISLEKPSILPIESNTLIPNPSKPKDKWIPTYPTIQHIPSPFFIPMQKNREVTMDKNSSSDSPFLISHSAISKASTLNTINGTYVPEAPGTMLSENSISHETISSKNSNTNEANSRTVFSVTTTQDENVCYKKIQSKKYANHESHSRAVCHPSKNQNENVPSKFTKIKCNHEQILSNSLSSHLPREHKCESNNRNDNLRTQKYKTASSGQHAIDIHIINSAKKDHTNQNTVFSIKSNQTRDNLQNSFCIFPDTQPKISRILSTATQNKLDKRNESEICQSNQLQASTGMSNGENVNSGHNTNQSTAISLSPKSSAVTEGLLDSADVNVGVDMVTIEDGSKDQYTNSSPIPLDLRMKKETTNITMECNPIDKEDKGCDEKDLLEAFGMDEESVKELGSSLRDLDGIMEFLAVNDETDNEEHISDTGIACTSKTQCSLEHALETSTSIIKKEQPTQNDLCRRRNDKQFGDEIFSKKKRNQGSSVKYSLRSKIDLRYSEGYFLRSKESKRAAAQNICRRRNCDIKRIGTNLRIEKQLENSNDKYGRKFSDRLNKNLPIRPQLLESVKKEPNIDQGSLGGRNVQGIVKQYTPSNEIEQRSEDDCSPGIKDELPMCSEEAIMLTDNTSKSESCNSDCFILSDGSQNCSFSDTVKNQIRIMSEKGHKLVIFIPFDRHNGKIASSGQKAPETCPICHEVLCPSNFTVSVLNFSVNTICVGCRLNISLVFKEIEEVYVEVVNN